jgi:hypothetical protein
VAARIPIRIQLNGRMTLAQAAGAMVSCKRIAARVRILHQAQFGIPQRRHGRQRKFGDSRNKDSAANWTSARLKTQGFFSFQYGRIEARMKLQAETGLWPAFWMLGSGLL